MATKKTNISYTSNGKSSVVRISKKKASKVANKNKTLSKGAVKRGVKRYAKATSKKR